MINQKGLEAAYEAAKQIESDYRPETLKAAITAYLPHHQSELVEALEFEKNFTGLKDRLGRPIMVGNIVHWTDGGDDLSLQERIAKRWDRIAKVAANRKQVSFSVIDSPHKEVRTLELCFKYGSFMYQDTERYLTIVAENEAAYHAKFNNAGECMTWVLQALSNYNKGE